jgi:hypothetical protein
MKTNHKKILKLVTLLLSSLLIGTASATVYRYMTLQGSIAVGTLKLIWLQGSDASATITGSTAILSLSVENNTAVNFTEAIFLKNNATGSYTYNITITNSLDSNDFEEAKIHIYENYTTPWTYLGTIDLTNSNSYYSNTLPQDGYLRLTIEVKAIQDSISRNFAVQVEYWPAA